MSKIRMVENYYTGGRWFLRNYSFDYTGTIMEVTGCDQLDKPYRNCLMKHYVINVDDVVYHIPHVTVVVTELEAEEEKKNIQKYFLESIEDRTVDMVAAAKEVLGIDIDNTYRPEYDLRAYERIMRDVPT